MYKFSYENLTMDHLMCNPSKTKNMRIMTDYIMFNMKVKLRSDINKPPN